MEIRRLLKKIEPLYLILRYFKVEIEKTIMKIKIRKVQKLQKISLLNLKNKKTLRCVFLVVESSAWKYDGIYSIMEKDERFDPILLICPMVNYGKERMYSNLIRVYDYFKERKYNVVISYHKDNNTYVDLNDLNPDILFYTNPYKGLIDDRYYLTNFYNILTVYVPYFISSTTAYGMSFNEEMHNLVWRKYCETDIHKSLSIAHSFNHGINTVTTGYPGIEYLLDSNPQYIKKDERKLIIWAPHHTIEPEFEVIYYSCFIKYYEFMLKMARKYENKIIIAFKPHPLLKEKLYLKWGREQTDLYYHRWETEENTILHESDYIELFQRSDAMIHDSGSFIAEYLYTNKPVMRTLNGEELNKMYNEFGLKCISNHYLAYNENDIENFIHNVIDGVDPLKDKRSKFVNEVLKPKGSPSQNIINDILDSIDNQILFRN